MNPQSNIGAEFHVAGDPAALERWPVWPAAAFDYAELLEQAETSLARREQAYPEWIRKGLIASEAAEADIAAWRLLVAEWRWIVSGPESPGAELPPPATLHARRAAVDLSIERIEAEARRRQSADLAHQAALLHALRWHLQRTDGPEPSSAPRVHRMARLTRLLRADAASFDERKAA